ncbi:hypothetical protein RQM47_10300 [Rubrivirga sp. S365]|uniref:Lipoprotein n=1 Tax=Rubrivirga litoralis TaxID=3075598 RepID=A0ABU3BS68_9BACT|nr:MULTISPECIES: hypothetical protein [unclassified Rubrivirga]MDT0632140.1 hypothetical protein [Rubrivirga sp. F394]MDT7857031.1 hypothetical protein [Rubrivirga sp. S365]
MSRSFLRRASEVRGGLYLTTGLALTTGAAAPLVGCQPAAPPPPPPAEQAVPITGVEVVVQQQEDGSFLIADEKVVEGAAGGATVIYTDGRVERIADPDAFAAKLPAEPPPQEQVRPQGGGFSLGNVLMFSLLMNAWSPARYGGVAYNPPPRAYANRTTFDRVNRQARPAVQSARARGTLATPQRTTAFRQAQAVRQTAPTRSRSGAFGRSGRGGRGFGG